MPTYEYACLSCGHRFDLWQEVGAAAPACEECDAAVKKVFQAPRVIFKGSGFYLTDLRSESAAKNKAANKEPDGQSSQDAANEQPSAASAGDAKTGNAKAQTPKTEPAGADAAAPKPPAGTADASR